MLTIEKVKLQRRRRTTIGINEISSVKESEATLESVYRSIVRESKITIEIRGITIEAFPKVRDLGPFLACNLLLGALRVLSSGETANGGPFTLHLTHFPTSSRHSLFFCSKSRSPESRIPPALTTTIKLPNLSQFYRLPKLENIDGSTHLPDYH